MNSRCKRWLRLGLLWAWMMCPLGAWAQSQTLTLSAAASLSEVLRDIGRQFTVAHPEVTLRFNFASSGLLLRQIAQGAPVDVFISADTDTMDTGIQQNLLDAATVRTFASNSLVLVVPASSALKITRLADLTQPAVQRVAVGKVATVPAGRYTRQALEAAGLWAALEPRLVPVDNVRQVLDFVARGEVDAGFVYRTDALQAADKVRTVLVAPGHAPVRYPAALVSFSSNRAMGQAFLDSLLNSQAQASLAQHDFGRP